MPTQDPVRRARGRLAGLHRRRTPDVATVEAARRDLTAAKAERAIRDALAAEPAITAQQRAELAAILLGGVR